MPRADHRPDPWSAFAMRPAFRLLVATLSVGFCGFMVYAYFATRPHNLFVPVDTTSGKSAAFGIFVDSAAYGRVEPATGVWLNGSVFNKTWPFGLVVAAWDDGRVAWSVGARPEDGEVVWGMTSPQIVASTRERIVTAMDDPSRPSKPPYGYSDGPRIVAFARDGERYQKIECQSWQVEPKVEDELRLGPFREKWAACRVIATEVLPKEGEKHVADWLGFQRDNK